MVRMSDVGVTAGMGAIVAQSTPAPSWQGRISA